jgi:hypothetical protein
MQKFSNIVYHRINVRKDNIKKYNDVELNVQDKINKYYRTNRNKEYNNKFYSIIWKKGGENLIKERVGI